MHFSVRALKPEQTSGTLSLLKFKLLVNIVKAIEIQQLKATQPARRQPRTPLASVESKSLDRVSLAVGSPGFEIQPTKFWENLIAQNVKGLWMGAQNWTKTGAPYTAHRYTHMTR